MEILMSKSVKIKTKSAAIEIHHNVVFLKLFFCNTMQSILVFLSFSVLVFLKQSISSI